MHQDRKIVITAANSFMGRYLARFFHGLGWDVVGIARRQKGMDENCRFVEWDGASLGAWAEELNGADLVVNLAGRSVNCRYNDENKKQILDSRIYTTRVVGEAIAQCKRPPAVWMNASTSTIYRHAEDKPQSEVFGEYGEGFSVGIAKAWEKEFFKTENINDVRQVAMRTSMVMADEPGTVFRYLLTLAKVGLGGKVASGQQRVSWIHMDDFCRAVIFLFKNEQIEGVVNITAPAPLTNAETMKRFRKAAGVPFGLPATKWMASIGAWALRTETELIFKSRWVVPILLETEGFVFKYPEMKPWEWTSAE